MNCAEKLLEPTIFLNLYTKSPSVRLEKPRVDSATPEASSIMRVLAERSLIGTYLYS